MLWIAAELARQRGHVGQLRRAFDLRCARTRICSTRVEPARGIPTMKIGSGASQPPPARANTSAVNSSMHRSTVRVIFAAR